MISTIRQQAILVALVQLPASESAPLIDQSWLENAADAISRLRKAGGNDKFCQLYDDAYDLFMARYNIHKVKDKAYPGGSLSDASNIANNEFQNAELPVTVIEKSLQRLDNIFDTNPGENAKKSYQQFSATPPATLTPKEDIIYDWAEFMCRSC